MTNTKKSTRRAVVSLKVPAKEQALPAFASTVVHAMTGNAAFASPTPALSAITAAATDLQTAEEAVLRRTPGAVTARNDRRGVLVRLLQQLGGYVQTIADADMENGAAIIESAGLGVRKVPVRAARTFAAKAGAVSGTATLVAASAGRRASYEWQYSSDGGKTWVTAPVTLQARTTVLGLQPAASVQFRYRPVTKTGEGDWSQTVSLIVR